MIQLAELYAPIAQDLEAAERVFNDELVSDQGFISDLCAHVARFHGKRVRPALVLLAGRACGEVTATHHTLAAVVEMVHIATLVHDDVLDEADIRRRAATVNRLWGNERAVLMGDFLISHAFHLCSSLDSQTASRLIGQTTNTVCEGEMMQVANRGNCELTEDAYLDIITRKTAALIETCCQLGAWAADADIDTVRRLRAFGRATGIAFQIIDDLLDLTGDESEVGKSLGRDMCEGEVTLPLIRYLQTADAGARREAIRMVEACGPGCQCELARRLRDSGSIDYAEAFARSQIAEACDALKGLPPTPARDSLLTMAQFVIARRR